MMSKFRSIVNPANWPITVKIPMLVVLLMVVISAVITNRVLARLAETQQRNLEQLSSAYLDGLSTSLIPSVFRGDIWEVFDVLDRSRERYRGLNVIGLLSQTAAKIFWPQASQHAFLRKRLFQAGQRRTLAVGLK